MAGLPSAQLSPPSASGLPRPVREVERISPSAIALEIENPPSFPTVAGEAATNGGTSTYTDRDAEAGPSAKAAAPPAFSSAAADIYRDETGGGGAEILPADEGARGAAGGGVGSGAVRGTGGGRENGEQDSESNLSLDDDVEDDLSLITLQRHADTRRPARLKRFCSQFLSPVASPITGIAAWMRELGRVFGWPLLGVVMVTYGINQGYASSLTDLSLSYYWKDVQHLQPAAAQFYMSFVGIPWDVKPLYGMITDTFPILGGGAAAWWALGGVPRTPTPSSIPSPRLPPPLPVFHPLSPSSIPSPRLPSPLPVFHPLSPSSIPLTTSFQRWPYIALSGVIGTAAWWALGGIPALVPAVATALLVTQSLFCAVPDVVVDGMVAQEIRLHPSYAADLQTLPAACLALASLLTYTISGSLIERLGPCGTFFLISLAPFSLIVAALLLPETRLPEGKRRGDARMLKRTWRRFIGTIRHRKIARAALFIFIVQGGVVPNITSGMFFWLTDEKQGPGFSEVFMGMVGAVGQAGMLLGVTAYNLWLRRFTYRSILFCTQFLLFATCFLDLILVTRTNLRLGIPDHAFVIGDQAFSLAMGRIQIMPILVLAARMCPSGIEATLFAFYMATSNFGITCSEWWGAALLHAVGVRRDSYGNLWMAVVVRMCARLLPLLALGLLPEGGPESEVVEQLELDGEGEEEEEEQEEQRGLVRKLEFDLQEAAECETAGGEASVGAGATGVVCVAAAAAEVVREARVNEETESTQLIELGTLQ
ncbi:unnamed protein product [Closterium sp. NIES-64]|nr:unnamed protein product [Closterium sp. NIES-64]